MIKRPLKKLYSQQQYLPGLDSSELSTDRSENMIVINYADVVPMPALYTGERLRIDVGLFFASQLSDLQRTQQDIVKKIIDIERLHVITEDEVEHLKWELRGSKFILENAESTARSIEPNRYSILSQVDEILLGIEENSGDLVVRLGLMPKLRKKLRDLWIFARMSGHKYLKHLASTLYDSVKNIKSEDLSAEQLNSIKEIVRLMKKESLNGDDLRKADHMLIEANLDYMPQFEEFKEDG